MNTMVNMVLHHFHNEDMFMKSSSSFWIQFLFGLKRVNLVVFCFFFTEGSSCSQRGFYVQSKSSDPVQKGQNKNRGSVAG